MKSKTPTPAKKAPPKTKTIKKEKSVMAAEEPIHPVPLTDAEYVIQKILVEDGKKLYPFTLGNIIAVTGDGNYVVIHQLYRPEIRILNTLKYMKERMAVPHFITIHDSYLINIHHVVSFIPVKEGRAKLMLLNGIELIVSRENFEYVREAVRKDALVIIQAKIIV